MATREEDLQWIKQFIFNAEHPPIVPGQPQLFPQFDQNRSGIFTGPSSIHNLAVKGGQLVSGELDVMSEEGLNAAADAASLIGAGTLLSPRFKGVSTGWNFPGFSGEAAKKLGDSFKELDDKIEKLVDTPAMTPAAKEFEQALGIQGNDVWTGDSDIDEHINTILSIDKDNPTFYSPLPKEFLQLLNELKTTVGPDEAHALPASYKDLYEQYYGEEGLINAQEIPGTTAYNKQYGLEEWAPIKPGTKEYTAPVYTGDVDLDKKIGEFLQLQKDQPAFFSNDEAVALYDITDPNVATSYKKFLAKKHFSIGPGSGSNLVKPDPGFDQVPFYTGNPEYDQHIAGVYELISSNPASYSEAESLAIEKIVNGGGTPEYKQGIYEKTFVTNKGLPKTPKYIEPIRQDADLLQHVKDSAAWFENEFDPAKREEARLAGGYTIPAVRGSHNPKTDVMHSHYTSGGKEEFYFYPLEEGGRAEAYGSNHYPVWLKDKVLEVDTGQANAAWNVINESEEHVNSLEDFFKIANAFKAGTQGNWESELFKVVNGLARDEGYETVKWENLSDAGGSHQTQLVALSPTGAKSWSAKEFNQQDPNILHAGGLPTPLLPTAPTPLWDDPPQRIQDSLDAKKALQFLLQQKYGGKS